MYEATVEKTFCASHALKMPGGGSEPMHGHNWKVEVTIAARGLDAMDTVMDIHELEMLLEKVTGPWNNRCLNEVEPFFSNGQLEINPSAERVSEKISHFFERKLPEDVWVQSVAVYEAPGCKATYRPS